MLDEAKVAIVPGEAFGAPGYARLASPSATTTWARASAASPTSSRVNAASNLAFSLAEGTPAVETQPSAWATLNDPGGSYVKNAHPPTDPLPRGTRVEVRDRFDRSFHAGFEVTRSTAGGYELRRLSDRTELPVVFAPDDVRPASP